MIYTKLIATYSRVSTATQEEQQTIKTQLNTLKDFSEKNNYHIVKEYIDDGWSGDILARPALDRLRQDAKSKMWEAILIYDPDRLARRYSYQELIMDELKEAGIEIIFVTISAPQNSEDKILYGVRGLFAEYERAKISERFRLGKVRKVKEGHILLSTAPYGYDYIPRKDNIHGYIEINPKDAMIVKMIFNWVDTEGLTQRKIINRLKELNIQPRKSKRGVWSTSTLTTLLKNKTYIGEAKWGCSYSVVPNNPKIKDTYRKIKKSSRKVKPESEWYTIPVPAIIEKEVFDRVRNRIESNFKLSQRNTRNEYLLTGVIYCSCGKRRTGEGPQNGKYLYYRCCDRINNFPFPKTCEEKGIDAKIADRMVWNKIAKLLCSPELVEKQIDRFSALQKNKEFTPLEDIQILEKEITKLKIEEERYSKAYGAGLFTIEKLSEYILPIKEKISSLEIQINRVNQMKSENEALNMKIPTKEQIHEFTEKARVNIKDLSFEQKKCIIRSVISKIEGTPQKLKICGYIPITTENNVDFFSGDRNGVSSNRQLSKENTIIDFEFQIALPPIQRIGIDYGYKAMQKAS